MTSPMARKTDAGTGCARSASISPAWRRISSIWTSVSWNSPRQSCSFFSRDRSAPTAWTGAKNSSA
jgi:hypothetical protein